MTLPLSQSGGAASASATTQTFSLLNPYVSGLAVDTVFSESVTSTGDGAAINYTVPTGKRAVLELWSAQNKPGTTDVLTLEFKVNGAGSWIPVLTLASPAALNLLPSLGIGQLAVASMIFEAGDLVALKASAGTSHVHGVAYTFDDSPAGLSQLKTPRFLGPLLIGDNTVYTVPVGKKALHLPGLPNALETPSLNVTLTASCNVGRAWYRKPSGVAIDTASHRLNTMTTGIVITSGGSLTKDTVAGGAAALTAGDSLECSIYGNTAFAISSVAAASGGNTVYTGTITGGTSNAFANVWFYVINLATANCGLFKCTASTTTTLTLNNPSGVAETHAGVCVAAKFPLSAAANASGGNTTYTGVFVSNNLQDGWTVNITGFANSANNGTFKVVGGVGTSTSMTVVNPNGVAETHSGEADFTQLDPILAWVGNIFEF